MLKTISSTVGRKYIMKGGTRSGWAQHQSNVTLSPTLEKYKR